MRRVLVTGGAGQVGRAVVRELQDCGDYPLVLDTRPFDGVERHAGRCDDLHNLLHLAQDCAAILHLEWSGSVQQTSVEPHLLNQRNTEAMLNVLQAAQENRIPLVFTSTAMVYAGDSLEPLTESVVGPRSLYGAMKLYAENMLRAHCLLHDLPGCSFRLFNVIGPGGQPFQIVPNIARAIREKVPLRLTGDGRQVRDFVPVGLIAKALVRSLAHSELRGESINLGSGTGYSMLDLVQTSEQCSSQKIEIEYVPAKVNESRFIVADMSRFESVFGPSPGFSLESELGPLLSLERKELA